MNTTESTPTTNDHRQTIEKNRQGLWFEHLQDTEPRDILDKARNMTHFLQDTIIHGNTQQMVQTNAATSGLIEILGCIAGLIDMGSARFDQRHQNTG